MLLTVFVYLKLAIINISYKLRIKSERIKREDSRSYRSSKVGENQPLIIDSVASSTFLVVMKSAFRN